MSNFQEKSIIITGAAMGLGLATAQELAARGLTSCWSTTTKRA